MVHAEEVESVEWFMSKTPGKTWVVINSDCFIFVNSADINELKRAEPSKKFNDFIDEINTNCHVSLPKDKLK